MAQNPQAEQKVDRGRSANIYIISWHMVSVKTHFPRGISCHGSCHWQGAGLRHDRAHLHAGGLICSRLTSGETQAQGGCDLSRVGQQLSGRHRTGTWAFGSLSSLLPWAESHLKKQSFQIKHLPLQEKS